MVEFIGYEYGAKHHPGPERGQLYACLPVSGQGTLSGNLHSRPENRFPAEHLFAILRHDNFIAPLEIKTPEKGLCKCISKILMSVDER
jgi:hypothetical protein